jgi:hypothetical protein
MKPMKILALTSLALLVGACSAVPRKHYQTTDIYLSPGVTQIVLKEGKVNLKTDHRVTCDTYRPTGTNIPLTYCTTLVEARKAREKAQQMLLLATSNRHSN